MAVINDDNRLIEKAELAAIMTKALNKIDALMARTGPFRFPDLTTQAGFYPLTDNVQWTPGFYSGMIMLAYDYTGEEKYAEFVKAQLSTYQQRLENGGKPLDTHDLGFLYSLSAVAYYKRFADTNAKNIALAAAECLSKRFLVNPKMIQAWNPDVTGIHPSCGQAQMIIDTNLNLPLLIWAYQQTAQKAYLDVACTHLETVFKYLIRPDFTQYHTYVFDALTGAPIGPKTHQGLSDESIWARGQAWCVLGFALAYTRLKDPKYLDYALKTLDQFIALLPDDLIAPWDFMASDGQVDSSSNAIVVCGILELVKTLPEAKRGQYLNLAHTLFRPLLNYLDEPDWEGVLPHSVRNYRRGLGVDECSLWGDYFCLEAVMRMLSSDWESYW